MVWDVDFSVGQCPTGVQVRGCGCAAQDLDDLNLVRALYIRVACCVGAVEPRTIHLFGTRVGVTRLWVGCDQLRVDVESGSGCIVASDMVVTERSVTWLRHDA